jgi:hypothetical protein
LTKGINQYSYTDYANGNGEKVNLSFQVFASGTRFNRVVTVSESKYQSSSALGSRGVAGSNDFSGFKSSASVVAVMNVSANDSAGRWGSPRGEFLLSGNNGESELGYEVFGAKPAHVNGLEWVMNFDSETAVNNLGLNHDHPHNCTNSHGIRNCDKSSLDIANGKVRNSSERANEGDYCQIDPITAVPVDVKVSHVGQTIADCNTVSSFSATKEGNLADAK